MNNKSGKSKGNKKKNSWDEKIKKFAKKIALWNWFLLVISIIAFAMPWFWGIVLLDIISKNKEMKDIVSSITLNHK